MEKIKLSDSQRYYLHRRIKLFARMTALNKKGIIYLTRRQSADGIGEQNQVYLNKLQAIGYSVQLTIN